MNQGKAKKSPLPADRQEVALSHAMGRLRKARTTGEQALQESHAVLAAGEKLLPGTYEAASQALMAGGYFCQQITGTAKAQAGAAGPGYLLLNGLALLSSQPWAGSSKVIGEHLADSACLNTRQQEAVCRQASKACTQAAAKIWQAVDAVLRLREQLFPQNAEAGATAEETAAKLLQLPVTEEELVEAVRAAQTVGGALERQVAQNDKAAARLFRAATLAELASTAAAYAHGIACPSPDKAAAVSPACPRPVPLRSGLRRLPPQLPKK